MRSPFEVIPKKSGGESLSDVLVERINPVLCLLINEKNDASSAVFNSDNFAGVNFVGPEIDVPNDVVPTNSRSRTIYKSCLKLWVKLYGSSLSISDKTKFDATNNTFSVQKLCRHMIYVMPFVQCIHSDFMIILSYGKDDLQGSVKLPPIGRTNMNNSINRIADALDRQRNQLYSNRISLLCKQIDFFGVCMKYKDGMTCSNLHEQKHEVWNWMMQK